jgi:hypothetical protein
MTIRWRIDTGGAQARQCNKPRIDFAQPCEEGQRWANPAMRFQFQRNPF